MGAYKYIKESFQKSYKERDALLRSRVTSWRKQGSVVRVETPTNISRARELGYRAKPGVIVVRVRVEKGLSVRSKPSSGRKPSKYGRFFAYRKSAQSIAEERAARKFINCEPLNSYYIGEDGKYKFFETILVDRSNPNITSDPVYSSLSSNRGRAFRGLTSSGKKHRGLWNKGFGSNKGRPSVRAKTRNMFKG